MEVYYNYVLKSGTSEGVVTCDDGRQASWLLWIPIESPSQWKLGVSTNPECDVLVEMMAGRFLGYYYANGTFDKEMSEQELYGFIETQLRQYLAQTPKV